MYLLGICDNPDVLSFMMVLNTILLAIKVVIPLVLVLSLSIRFMNAVRTGNEDLFKKARQVAVKNAIAVVLIFLVPMFVSTVVVAAAGGNSYAGCLDSANASNINALYSARANNILSIAENEQNYSTLGQARMEISKIRDPEEKKSLTARANALEETIKEKTETKDPQTIGNPNGGNGSGYGNYDNPQPGENPNFDGTYIWPCNGPITSYFGPRAAPTAGASTYHKGIDIGVPTGTAINACAAGTVSGAGYNSSGGNYVYIDHGNGMTTQYLHNSKVIVTVGQKVKQGQTVAYAGSTGISTGPHLHLGFKLNGSHVNPMSYLP